MRLDGDSGNWRIVDDLGNGRVVIEGAGGGRITVPRSMLVDDTPRARNSDPHTAHLAAQRVNLTADRDLVLRCHVEAGLEGLTGDELALSACRPYESIGPRRPALEQAGYIAKVPGSRRKNRNGNAEQVYAITEAGQREWRRICTEGAA